MRTEARTSKIKHDAAKGVTEDGRLEVAFNFPIYEDYEEFTGAAGSPEAGLEFINAQVRDDAAGKVRDFISDQKGTPEEIVAAAIKYAESYSPTARITNRAKAAELDSLLAAFREKGAEGVQEDLMALAARL